MRKVGILGLGAIGHLLAAQLWEKSGLHLYFFNRTERTRLRFRSHLGQLIDEPITCHTQPTTDKLDWLLVCLKTYHYPEATAWLTALIQPSTQVVVLRNGLDLKAPLLQFTNSAMILPALVDGPTQYHPGRQQYKQLAPARLTLPSHPLGPLLQSLLEDSELQVQEVVDFKTASWKKLIESASLGAITCLSGRTCAVLQDEAMKGLYRQLLEEGIQVALADGAQLPDKFEDQLLAKLAGYPAEKGSSMLSDRLMGRPIEVMAKNGIISRKGKEWGIATPLNDHFTRLLKQVNRTN